MTTVVKDEKLEFAADVPFVRHVLDTDEKASVFSEQHADRLKAVSPAAPQANKGDAVISGYANTWVMDRDMEYVSKQAFETTLPKYLEKNPIILLQHNHDWPLGQMMDLGTDLTGLAAEGFVRQPKDRDPDWKHGAYNDVVAGILRTLSIGGFFWRDVVDGDILVVEIDLFEISVVAVPSNPDSIFEATQKAAQGLGLRSASGTAKLFDQMQQLLGMQPVTDPALVGMPERFKRAKYYELASEYTKQFDQTPPDFEAWTEVCLSLERGGEGKNVKAISEEAHRVLEKFAPRQAIERTKSGIVVTEKAGRTLSKANEAKVRGAVDKIKDAADNLQGILDALPDQDEQAQAATLKDLKGIFGQVFNAYELQDALWDGFWALRDAISTALGVYEQDATPDIAAVVEACNEFRDWLIDKAQQFSGDVAVRAGMTEDLKVLAAVLGDRKAKDSERHCPECGAYMDNAEGAACPECGHTPKAAGSDGKSVVVIADPFNTAAA